MIEIDYESLHLYNPRLDLVEFFEMYGEDYTEWFPYAKELSELAQSLYPWREDFAEGIPKMIHPQLSPFNVYFTNKSLKPFGLSVKDLYRSNSSFFRSDEFSKKHDGLHILFAGCSITFGDGMFEEYSWPYLVHQKISQSMKTSGLYNIAFPGANHSDIILQIFKYINEYGNPDLIFINFPDIERQIEHGMGKTVTSEVVSGLYMTLELYCKSQDIRLISFSWDDVANKNYSKLKKEGWTYKESPNEDPREFFGDTYHRYNIDSRHEYLMNFQKENKDHKYKDFFLRAFDITHPGIAEQSFYAKIAYDIWRTGVCND